MVVTTMPPHANATSSAPFLIALYAANARPCSRSGTRSWISVRASVFFVPRPVPPGRHPARNDQRAEHHAHGPGAAFHFEVRDHKVTRFVSYWERPLAFEALGLPARS
jgi:hypothetical protein